MTRFTDYTAQALTGVITCDWRYDLIDPAGEVLASTHRVDGAIRWGATMRALRTDAENVSQRTASLQVLGGEPRLLAEHPESVTDPEKKNRVRISSGFFVPGEDRWVWFTQGTMHVQETVSTAEAGTVSHELSLADPLEPFRSQLTSVVTWEDGEAVETVVERLMAEVAVDVSISPTGFTVPTGSAGASSDRFQIVDNLLSGCGHELVADPSGLVYSRQIPTADRIDGEEFWAYGGPGGIPVSSATSMTTVKVAKGWQADVGSLQTSDVPASLVFWDTDPRSKGFYTGPGDVSIESDRWPFVEIGPQAAAAAYGQFRRHGTGPGLVTITCPINPAMQQNDLVHLEYPDLLLSGDYRVQAITLPLEVQDEMTVTLRGVWNPAIGYVEPVTSSGGCLLAIRDTFERPNENLENSAPSGGQAGSTFWTEIGPSWGIENELAVQRWNGWSLAFINIPLCSSDQSVEVGIEEVPQYRRIGPAVRCDGQFNCYTALMSSTGWVSLEVWQNGRSIQTLATHHTNDDPSNKRLRLTVQGSLLTVELGTDVLMTANDSRLGGSHVGMLGLGYSSYSGPKANEFEAQGA